MKHHSRINARQHRGFSRCEMVLLGSVGALCCVFLWPALAQNAAPDDGKPLTDEQKTFQCQSNLKQMGLASLQYCQDYDELLPLVSVRGPQNEDDYTPVGWGDAIQPYLKSVSILQCPAERNASSMTRVKQGPFQGMLSDAAQLSGYTDYWYNANLTQINDGNIEMHHRTILFGEGDGGAINSTARYALGSLYAAWVKNPHSPAYRHGEGKMANYCFADGHVKALPADKVSNKAPRLLADDEATFEEGLPVAGLQEPNGAGAPPPFGQ